MNAPDSDQGDGRLATVDVADGSCIEIAWIGDSYALRVQPRVALDVVFMSRDELRRVALELIAATQLDLRNPSETQFDGMRGFWKGR